MVNIRRIQANDTEAVRDLINDIMRAEFPSESGAYACDDLDGIREHYGGGREIFLVAEKDGKIVGTVAIKEDGAETALLRRVFVHKHFRGQGYGAKLLNKALQFCFEQRYKTVTFRGTNKMQNALRLCLKNGFEQKNVAELGDFSLIVLSKKLQA